MRAGLALGLVLCLCVVLGLFYWNQPQAAQPAAATLAQVEKEAAAAETAENVTGEQVLDEHVREAADPGPEIPDEKLPVQESTRESAPEPRLHVRVVDASGRLREGVGVALSLTLGRASEAHSQATGADGLARFENGWTLDYRSAKGVARVEGLFDPPVELPFTLANLPNEPLELVLPPHGSVLVEVLDSDSEPLHEAGHSVCLRLQSALFAGARIYNHGDRLCEGIQGSRVHFPLVGLGLKLELSMDARPKYSVARVECEGPNFPGEERVAHLQLSSSTPSIVFRLLEPNGAPLCDAEVVTTWTRAMGGATLGSTDRLRTDAEGRGRLLMEGINPEQSTVTIALDHTSTRSRVAVELTPGMIREGETDLGDLLMSGWDPLVSGRVVDPVEGLVNDISVLVEQNVPEQPDTWYPFQYGITTSDGSFEVYADPPQAALRLRVESELHQPHEPIRFAPGARDLLVTLKKGGSLTGSVLVPEENWTTDFEARVVVEAGGEPRSSNVEPDGTFSLQGLPEGRVSLGIHFQPWSEAVVRIDNLVIPPAGECKDPRLLGIDLRGLVRKLALRLTLPDGSPAKGGWVRTIGRGRHPHTNSAFIVENGVAQVLAARLPLDLEVRVPGCRSAILKDVAEDRSVMLEAGYRVSLQLAADVVLPPAGSNLQATLTPLTKEVAAGSIDLFRGAKLSGWWNEAFGDERNTFDERRELLLDAPAEGSYRLSFHYVSGSPDSGSISINIKASEFCETISVNAGSGTQAIRVAPDPVDYAERLKGGG